MDLVGYLKSNSDFDNHIIIDEKATWPKLIYDLIDSSKCELQNYINERKRIEIIRNRATRPKNEYEDKWNSVVDLVDSYLQKHEVIGFQCSRLLDDEIEDILVNGLTPLNRDFAIQRINTVCEKGLIPYDLREKLFNKEELRDENREGAIRFFHNTSELRIEMGLYEFFKLWGGEAIYSGFEKDPYLQKIGVPCIIMVSIEYQDLVRYNLSQRMICFFLGESNYFDHKFESLFAKKIKVLTIVKRNNKLFNYLTNINHWDEKIN